MAKRTRKGMFRDFKKREVDRLGSNYNKYHRLAVRDIVGSTDLGESELNFLIFIYDYEFFTIDHISDSYFYSKLKLARKLVYPLNKKEYLFKYYDKLAPKEYEAAMFDEGRFGYRIRYAISQRGRLLVQKYYRKIEGLDQISVPTSL